MEKTHFYPYSPIDCRRKIIKIYESYTTKKKRLGPYRIIAESKEP
jgi:hypothetical protein